MPLPFHALDRPLSEEDSALVEAALQQYAAPGGAKYTVDDSVAPKFEKFFQRLQEKGYTPEDIQGFVDRNIRGTNTPSKHRSGEAVDIDPNKHPEGKSGTWGPIDIQALAREAGLRSLADRKGSRGPDEMHVENDPNAPSPVANLVELLGGGTLPPPSAPITTGSNPPAKARPGSSYTPLDTSKLGSGRMDVFENLLGMGGYASPASDENGALGKLKADPISRAAVLSTALQMMVGGYGNPLQQLGVALGHGAESAGNTAAAIRAQEINDRDFMYKSGNDEANRGSHEKIAQIGADSRQEVANIRSQAMLERAQMIHGPQNDKEMRIYADARNKYYTTEKNNQIITRKSDQQILSEADAYAKEQLRGARSNVLMGAGGDGTAGAAPPAAGTPGKTSNNLLTAPDDTSPAGTPPTAQSATGTPPTAGKPTWEQVQKIPAVQQALQTPEGRARILKERPDFTSQIREIEKEQLIQSNPAIRRFYGR